MGSYYEVQVRPNADGWAGRLVAQVDPVTRKIANDLRDRLHRAMREGMSGLNLSTDPAVRRQGQQQGSQFADAFSREVQSRLERAVRQLPEVKLRADSSAVDREIRDIRRQLAETVQQLEFGVDPASVERQVQQLKTRLAELAANSTDVRVRVNTTAALAEIQAFQAAMKGQGAKAADKFEDAFTRTTRAKLKAAFESLPEIKITANSSDVDRELAALRRKLGAADRAIGLGVDTKLVDARLDEVRAKLERLARTSPDIRVRVNSGTALAELEALKRSMRGFDRDSPLKRLLADLRQSLPLLDQVIGKLGTVSSAGSGAAGSNPYATLGLAAAIVAALSTIGPLAAAGTGGVLGLAGAAGVAALAFKGLKDQVDAGQGFGPQIKGELSGIGAEIDSLAEDAANIVGPTVSSLLGSVRRVLPEFRPIVTLVSGQLGRALESVGGSLITGAQKAAPLFADIGHYIELGAAKLQRWVASPSFDRFLAYARQQLPILIGYAGDFGQALIDTFVALAPLGEGVLKVIDWLVKGLDKVANTAGGITALVSGLSPLTGLGGLIGNLFGGDDQKKADATTSAMDDVIAKLKELTETVTGTGSADQFAGISTGVAALLGTTNDAYAAATAAAKSNADQLAQTTLQMQIQGDAAGLLKQALDQLTGKQLNVAQADTTFQQGLLGIDDAFTKTAFSATAFNDAAVAQRATLQQLVTQAQAHAQAVADQTHSTEAGTQALKNDYAQILTNTGATGVNRDAILAYITSIGGIPAVKMTKTEADTALGLAQVGGFKASLAGIPALKKIELYLSTSGAQAAIQKFVSTPRTAYVQVQTVGVNGGSGGKAVLNAYGGIYDSVPAYALGGIIDKLAASVPSFAGGSENHVPQIASAIAGRARIWAEPETQGEAYIPFAMDRRPRAEVIAARVAERFGGAYLSKSVVAAVSAGRPAAGALNGGVSLNGTPVLVNVIDRDGSFVERMRGEIAIDTAAQVHARGAGNANHVG